MSAAADHAAAFAAAPLVDLIACARVFFSAINATGKPFSEADMATLVRFDDHICETIAARQPSSPEEWALKTRFLMARVQAESLSDAAEQAALSSIAQDANRFCPAGTAGARA